MESPAAAIGRAVSFRKGDWTVGLLVGVEGGELNHQIRIADSIGDFDSGANEIVARGSGGDGVLVRDSDGMDYEIDRLETSGHAVATCASTAVR